MLQSWKNWCWKLQLGTSLTISGAIIALSGNYALAQSIVPDSTLGAERSTVIKPDVNTDEIRGGAIRGKNVFHSFEKFSVSNNGIAHFQNAANIQNIITRVTGESVSNINGTLKANGTANLFLLNPNGIIFGQNARLDIGGSFVASTASSLAFADGSQFSATEPQTQPLLTVSVPMGLQFGTGAGSIRNQSVVVDSNGFTVGLQVRPEKTLALVGGDVALEGGYLTAGGDLTAQAGRIELGSVAGPSLVGLTQNAQAWVLEYEGVQNFRDIQLSQAASVNASGDGGGNIQVQGRRVSVGDGSAIAAISAEGSGGTLAVNASESVKLIGSSGLRTDNFGSGSGGDVSITTGKLIVQSGAFVSTNTGLLGNQGQGGNLEVTASDSVELSGTSPDGEVFSSLLTATTGPGNAGYLKIETGNLIVRDEAQASVSSQGTGDAGDLEVEARSIRLDKQGSLSATTNSGRGGNINLHDLDLLLMRDNSLISAEALGGGQDGNINIDADLIVASENSDIVAEAASGGDITVTAQGIFGSQFRESQTSESDITSTGKVELVTPDVNPSQGLAPLPVELVDVAGLIVQGCSTGGGNVARGQSEFIITGRGGLPPTPREALASEPALVDLGKPIQGQDDNASIATSITPTSSLPNTIVEAQGWVIGPKGEVVLTAQAPTVTPHSPWGTPPNCHPS